MYKYVQCLFKDPLVDCIKDYKKNIHMYILKGWMLSNKVAWITGQDAASQFAHQTDSFHCPTLFYDRIFILKHILIARMTQPT